MRKIYLLGAFCAALIVASCGSNASHDGHNHEAEGHDHETENHSHESGEHNHAEGEECGGDAAEEESVHADEIIFPVAKAEAAGVKVETIQPKSFYQVISVSGQVLAAQGDETTVVANVAGVVSFRSPVTDGMTVRQGMPLVVLSSKDMVDGNPVQRAKVAYDIARQEYERAKGLLDSKIVSEKDFNSIKQNYENARISYDAVAKNQTAGGQMVKAPMGGYIKSCLVNEGDYVQIGQPLMSITQNRRLFLRADVGEKYYTYLPKISSANFKTPYDNKVYELSDLRGRVLSYGKASGASSFYIPVTFEFDNKGDIIPGSYVEVYLLSSAMPDVLALPHTALTEEQGSYFIYLQLDAEGYRKQEVSLGVDNGKEVQILSGLKAGEKVVTEGAYQVKLASVSNALPAHGHEH